MVETYDITINRNQDNFIYSTPFFNINVTLQGEKGSSQNETTSINCTFQNPLPQTLPANTTIQIFSPDGSNRGNITNSNQNTQTQISYQSMIKCMIQGNGWFRNVSTLSPNQQIDTTPTLILATDPTKPSEINFAIINTTSSNITLDNINVPSGTTLAIYKSSESSSVTSYLITTFVIQQQYSQDSQMVYLQFYTENMTQNYNGEDPIIWYKIDTNNFHFFESSTPQPSS